MSDQKTMRVPELRKLEDLLRLVTYDRAVTRLSPQLYDSWVSVNHDKFITQKIGDVPCASPVNAKPCCIQITIWFELWHFCIVHGRPLGIPRKSSGVGASRNAMGCHKIRQLRKSCSQFRKPPPSLNNWKTEIRIIRLHQGLEVLDQSSVLPVQASLQLLFLHKNSTTVPEIESHDHDENDLVQQVRLGETPRLRSGRHPIEKAPERNWNGEESRCRRQPLWLLPGGSDCKNKESSKGAPGSKCSRNQTSTPLRI